MAETSSTVATDQDQIGKVLNGRYQLEAVLARGGMGTVYKARQVSLNRPVAVKLLHPDLEHDQSRRFLQEAHIVAQLDHPNCVAIHDYGQTDDGRSFIAMQLLTGRSLALETGEPLPAPRAAAMIADVLRGLEHAHARGVIHRDLKPENLSIGTDPHGNEIVRIVDFGIAKLKREVEGDEATVTMSGLMSGTPAYMSPEQAIGLDSDGRTDIYSVGMIFYELLAGHRAYDDEDAIALLQKHLTAPLPPLPDHVPERLKAIVAKMCDKDRAKRYPSAVAALQDVEAYLMAEVPGSVPGKFSRPYPVVPVEPGAPAPVVRESTDVLQDLEVEQKVVRANADTRQFMLPEDALENRPRGRAAYYVGAGVLATVALLAGFLVLRDSEGDKTDEPQLQAKAETKVDDAAKDEPEATPTPTPTPTPVPTPPPTPTEADTAAVGMDNLGDLVDRLNDHESPLPFVERQSARLKVSQSDQADEVDTRWQTSLDLMQAADAPSPCSTFAGALAGMLASPHDDYEPALELATPPEPDGKICPGVERQLEAALIAHGLREESKSSRSSSSSSSKKRSKKSSSSSSSSEAPVSAPATTAPPPKKKKRGGLVPKLDTGLKGID